MSVIARFPSPEPPPNPLGVALALHTEAARIEHEETLAWVRWIFQGIRARREAIVFHTSAANREGVIADWQQFAADLWHPTLAPALLQAWKAAHEEDVSWLLASGNDLSRRLPEDACERSAAAGGLLLKATHGAKYTGVLGRLRHELTHVSTDTHLVMVWAAVSVLFQVPPLDVLAEYLREEWLTALREHPELHEPQGPLCFTAMAQRALREAGMMGLALHGGG